MTELDNSKDMKPENSWPGAEKLLAQHFRRKKRILWLLLFLGFGIAITGSILLLNRDAGTVARHDDKISPTPTTEQNSDKTIHQVEISSNEIKESRNSGTKVSRRVSSLQSAEKSIPKTPPIRTGIQPSNSLVKIKKASSSLLTSSQQTLVREFQSEETVTSSKKPDSDSRSSDELKNPNTESVVLESNRKEEHFKTQSTVQEPIVQPVLEEVSHGVQERVRDSISIPDFPVAAVLPGIVHDSVIVNKPEDLNQKISVNHFRVQIYGASQMVFKNLSADQYPEYEARRKREEKSTITHTLGAALIHEGKKISFSAGFEYSSWGEKTEYSPYRFQEEIIHRTFFSSVSRIDTDTAYIRGNQFLVQNSVQDSLSVSYNDTVTSEKYDRSIAEANGLNRYHYLEIPLQVTYLLMDHRFGLGLSVGLSPAFLISQKGHYLKQDMSDVEEISNMKSIRTFMLNGRIGINLSFKLNTRLNLLFQPQLKANLNSVFKKESGVNQRYYSAGMTYGLTYLLK